MTEYIITIATGIVTGGALVEFIRRKIGSKDKQLDFVSSIQKQLTQEREQYNQIIEDLRKRMRNLETDLQVWHSRYYKLNDHYQLLQTDYKQLQEKYQELTEKLQLYRNELRTKKTKA